MKKASSFQRNPFRWKPVLYTQQSSLCLWITPFLTVWSIPNPSLSILKISLKMVREKRIQIPMTDLKLYLFTQMCYFMRLLWTLKNKHTNKNNPPPKKTQAALLVKTSLPVWTRCQMTTAVFSREFVMKPRTQLDEEKKKRLFFFSLNKVIFFLPPIFALCKK